MSTSSTSPATSRLGDTRGLGAAFVANLAWINASEVFRYLVLVMPEMRRSLPMLPDVAPMNIGACLIWGLWDTLLVASVTLASWLALERLSRTLRVAIGAGTACWSSIVVIFWLALWNMNLASPTALFMALPLAWIEMVVAALLVRWCLIRARG